MVAHDPPGPLGPRLYMGAPFQDSNSNAPTRMSRWDGDAWSLVSTPDGIGGVFGPSALSVCDDGAGEQLFATGASRLFRFDGQSWSSSTSPSDLSAASTAVFDDDARRRCAATPFQGGTLCARAPTTTQRCAKHDEQPWRTERRATIAACISPRRA
jgi:hypothetical protein